MLLLHSSLFANAGHKFGIIGYFLGIIQFDFEHALQSHFPLYETGKVIHQTSFQKKSPNPT